MISLTSYRGIHKKGTFSLSDLIAITKNTDNFRKAGAVALFVGVVRGETVNGEKVKKLILETYEEKANEVLEKICKDLSKNPGIINVQIHHLIGEFNVGEDLVYVSVAGSHRKEVWPTLRLAVDRYKSEAPIFKKELVIRADGSADEYWTSEEGCR